MSGKSWWRKVISSMKTGLVLLITISIVSAVGTLFPQGKQPTGDLYHSWWYVGLLSLLGINLVACNADRISRFCSFRRNRHLPGQDEIIKLKLHSTFSALDDIKGLKGRICYVLARNRYEVWLDESDGECKIGAQKGRFYLLGSLITHVSFIVILLGMLYGGICGYRGTIDAAVGSAFALSAVPGMGDIEDGDDLKLQVKKFWICKDDNGSVDYFSRLTLLKHEKAVKTMTIAVNHPMEYKGIKFYQSSYGQAVKVDVRHLGNLIREQVMSKGDICNIEGTDYSISLYQYYPVEGIYSGTPADNLKIIYALYKGKDLIRVGKAGIEEDVRIDEMGNSLSFTGFVPVSGLLIKRDPGVPFVILGGLLILLGIAMMVIIQPRKIWVILEKTDKAVNVAIGGTCRRNPVAFQKDFQVLINDAVKDTNMH